jgi:hypothetical protein
MRIIACLLALSGLAAACAGGGGGECLDGEWSCSADARTLTRCESGRWAATDCLADRGRLCEQGACVEPWRYGAPAWDACEGEPRATAETLADKAAGYEDLAWRLHVHPALRWLSPVTLAPDPGDPGRPAVAEAQATWEDVERWHSGENDGLWSALYLAAEAYRYAVTGEEEALARLRLLMDGEETRMRVTGVPGLFTRQFVPPGVPGIACPSDPLQYAPDAEKDDNQWVRVNAQGCVETYDAAAVGFVASSHCGLEAFAGHCWLDNVSKDEYAGHMLGLGAVALLVDDVELRARVAALLLQVGRHLVENRLELHDWDGRVTEHGRLWAMAMDDFPGFNAAMALAYLRVAGEASGDAEITAWYDRCLLQRAGVQDCLAQPIEAPRPYPEHLGNVGLYMGAGACASNWNNFSMHMISLQLLLLYERDATLRALYQAHLEDAVFAPPDTPRVMSGQHNAWFDFLFAAHKRLGPGSSGPALDAVRDGVCMLRQFPASKHQRGVTCPPERCALSDCVDRHGGPILEEPREIADRCLGGFEWWSSPYDPGDCLEDLRVIESPADYLLAYWMGRYYGFISPGW